MGEGIGEAFRPRQIVSEHFGEVEEGRGVVLGPAGVVHGEVEHGIGGQVLRRPCEVFAPSGHGQCAETDGPTSFELCSDRWQQELGELHRSV